jgi:hypothetical protein
MLLILKVIIWMIIMKINKTNKMKIKRLVIEG